MTAWTGAPEVGLAEDSHGAPGGQPRTASGGKIPATKDRVRRPQAARDPHLSPVPGRRQRRKRSLRYPSKGNRLSAPNLDSQLQFASRVMGRLVSGSKRTFDETTATNKIAAACAKTEVGSFSHLHRRTWHRDPTFCRSNEDHPWTRPSRQLQRRLQDTALCFDRRYSADRVGSSCGSTGSGILPRVQSELTPQRLGHA
jgi:hypothetical protein